MANLFPLLTGEAFQELAAGIKKNGLREPILLDADNDRMLLWVETPAPSLAIKTLQRRGLRCLQQQSPPAVQADKER